MNYHIGRRMKKERYSRIINTIKFILFILIFGGVFIRSGSVHVDEDDFCFQKITKEFPEYGFHHAEYSSEECIGYYESKIIERRDGLGKVSSNGYHSVIFKLLDEQDIDYIKSGNFAETVALIILLFTILALYGHNVFEWFS